jgi:hypothetical protein
MTPRILAIEPDRDSGHALRRFVQSCVDADLLVVESLPTARTAVDEFAPHVLLVSELLAPGDDVELTAHVRSRPSRATLPILTVPSMTEVPPDTPEPRGLLRLIASSGPSGRVFDMESRKTRLRTTLRHVLQATVVATVAGGEAAVHDTAKRARAPRWKGANIPWLTKVTMPLGLEVHLVNISRSGLLIESRGGFVVGQPTTFELHGADRVVRVEGRFIRSTAVREVAPDQHQAAAVFDADLTMFPAQSPGRVTRPPVVEMRHVLDWLREQAKAGLSAERIRAGFELSVQEILGARDVRVCRLPVLTQDGESLCVAVPTSDGSDAFLQATYDSARPPSTMAFPRLRAAATLAADMLEIEQAQRAIAH